MYESPIKMYKSDIYREIQKRTEEEFMSAVNQTIGFDVNKEELIKALWYDRNQYEKGFSDCKSYMLDKVKQAREEIENINPVYSTIGDRIPVLKNCDDIKAEVLEILDKLIENEEK